MAFQDHFSGHAATYAKFRPRYPAGLYSTLAEYCQERVLAWDCGTGNGQAAVGLADHFARVVATDASSQQIAHAQLHEQVVYRVGSESESGLPDLSVDLVTVAQALHWFQLPQFFAEAQRVLKSDGVIAVWCYSLNQLGNPFDEIVNRFYSETVGPYWPAERKLVEQGYRDIEFPFDELTPPSCVMQQELSLPGFLNYVETWSAVKRFEQVLGFSPMLLLEHELRPLWGNPQRPRLVTWPLHMRVGRKR